MPDLLEDPIQDPIEDDVRAALRYRGEQLQTLQQPELRLRHKARAGWVAGLAAAACVLAVVGLVTAVGLNRRSGPQAAAGKAAPGWAGQKWLLTSIRHKGTTLEHLDSRDATLSFVGKREADFDDTVNNSTVKIRPTANGFIVRDSGVSSAVGFAGRPSSPTGRIIAALGSLLPMSQNVEDVPAPVSVRAIVTGSSLRLTVNGYDMTFARLGTAPKEEPPLDTGQPAPHTTGPALISGSMTPDPPSSSASAIVRFSGTWLLTSITYRGRTTDVAAEDAGATFGPGDGLTMNGPTQWNGHITGSPDGFVPHGFQQVAISWATAMKDLAQLEEIVDAFNTFGDDVTVQTKVQKSALTLTSGGYTLSFTREVGGHVVSDSPAPTITAS